MRSRTLSLVVLLAGLVPLSVAAAEPPAALSPADERKAFIVPVGFEVQLIASEPDVQKPIQMAFDGKGRLWVTTSHQYPFASAPAGKARDKLFILFDFDPVTGKAKKVQTFADDLNVPIGILPLPDCKSCIVSSVGEIRKYTDTTGKGKADKMEVLFTGFGVQDTHAPCNSFTLMPDGWVYACYWAPNLSKVKGKDGHEVEMNPGDTFRFRPDGSRIEVYTHGQVRPFGITVDPWFNLYTAERNTKSITQLIPGAYYDSLGKPHDGLGYAPHLTRHARDLTALCGLAWYDADHFPKEYWGTESGGTMFLGNVVHNSIEFDRIRYSGSTPVAVKQRDFLVSRDPWFRPTDLKLGPDGALYVADCYRIIGDSDIDVKQPQKNQDRGRVWRIVWKDTWLSGEKPGTPPVPKNDVADVPKMPFTDLTAATEAELVRFLDSPNLTVRLAAMNELATRGEKGVKAIPKLNLSSPNGGERVTRAHVPLAMLAGRAGQIKDDDWITFVFWVGSRVKKPGDEEFVVGLARGLATQKDWSDTCRGAAIHLMRHTSPLVLRATMEAVIDHPHAEFVEPLVAVAKKWPLEDTHLRHAIRIALRNCLRDNEKAWPPFDDAFRLRDGFDPIYAEVALALPQVTASQYLLSLLQTRKLSPDRIPAVVEHIGRNGGDEERAAAIDWLTEANTYTPITGEAFLGFFRALQKRGRGTWLSERQISWILNLVDGELARKLPGASLHPDNVNRLLSLIRVITAIPETVRTWSEKEVPTRTVTTLSELATQATNPLNLRIAASEAIVVATPERGLPTLRRLFTDTTLPAELRERMLLGFAASGDLDARLDARDALKDLPYRSAIAIGEVFAGSRKNGEILLTAVKQGKAPARLLQEKSILERLRAANIPNLDKQVADLTRGLPPLDPRLAELIKQRAARYPAAKTDKELGAKLFTKHCGACHRIGDQGGKIAPQLDGIGNRGLERVLEDTLDPNRSVDQAYRARIITTKDGRTITAHMLRVEGEALVVADGEGKEIRIPTKDIDKNRGTMLSPMPANFGDVIPEVEFYSLIAYLLDQKAKDPPK